MSTAELLGFLLPVAVGLALVTIAVVVARTGWTQLPNRLFAALYFLSGTKSLAEGLLAPWDGQAVSDRFHGTAPLFPAAAAWADVPLYCALFMVPLLLFFILTFPKRVGFLQRRSALLGLGLLPSAAFAATVFLTAPQERAWLVPYLVGFSLVATAVTMLALVHLARVRARAQDARERTQATYLIAGFLPAFVLTWALTGADFTYYLTGRAIVGPEFYSGLVHYVSPVLEIAACALVAYAILKYRILSIELQVKGGVKYAIISAVLGTFMFVVSTYVGNFILQNQLFAFAGPAGSAALAGVGTILLFKPVEKVSGKVTDRLFPETTKDPETYARMRAREIYRVQCTYVLRDAAVTDRELAFLVALRSQLELELAEARAIEQDVERALGIDDARLGNLAKLDPLAKSVQVEAVLKQGEPPKEGEPQKAAVAEAPAPTEPRP